MPIQEWSQDIIIVDVSDEPAFSEEIETLFRRLDDDAQTGADVILNMNAVTFVNSTNIAQLLRLRKKLLEAKRRLRICSVTDSVWTVLLITGLDSMFEFTDDVTTALASLQIQD